MEDDIVNDNPLAAAEKNGPAPRLATGLAIGLAIRYASQAEEKGKTPIERINWSVLSLPFLWPLFRGVKEKIEESAETVSDGVRGIDLGRYTKPIRKRWKSWTN